MHFVAVVMVSLDDPSVCLTADDVRDALLRTARAGDRVEHIRVRALPGEVRIGVLSLAGDRAETERSIRDLCGRAEASEPVLAGWTVVPDSVQ